MAKRLSDEELEKRLRGFYGYEQVEVPKIPVQQRERSFQEIMLGYTDEEALIEAQRCMQCQDPPCVKACPAHLDVPGYCKAITEGDLKRGLQIIIDTFPLPGTCGRVCYHPCTQVCLKGVEGQPIEIARLRRYLADRVSQKDLEYSIPPPTDKKVAIIGSGPASLTCAYHLRRRGHAVVVFEKDEKPGGTLRVIPDYRLPDRVLQEEIDVLSWLGIEIKTNTKIEGEGCIDKLLEEFDAVFIGTGVVGSWKLPIPGADLEGTLTGYELLRRLGLEEDVPLGKKIAIIGGGDVAMDAARTALRAAEEVHLIYRRSPEEMTADKHEVIELIQEASGQEIEHLEISLADRKRLSRIFEIFQQPKQLTMKEMVEIEADISKLLKRDAFERLSGKHKKLADLKVYLMTQPVRILGTHKVSGVECQRMELGPPDESGRRAPVPIAGSEFVIEADMVIFAIGQQIDYSWLGTNSGIQIAKNGQIIIDFDTMQTSRFRVFAGGDVARGPVNMIQAIADGQRAAKAIDRLLAGDGGP